MSDYGEELYACGVPDAEIDPDTGDEFTFDLAPSLDGLALEDVEWVLPDGLTEVESDFDDTTATIFVNGAEACRIYRITCRYTPEGGRPRDKTIRVIGRNQ